MSTRRVLVVAPDPWVRRALRSLLESEPGPWAVVVEEDAQRARALLADRRLEVDVVVVDATRGAEGILAVVAASASGTPLVVVGLEDSWAEHPPVPGTARYVPVGAGPEAILAAVHAATRPPRHGARLAVAAAAAFAGPWLVWGSRIAEAHGLLGWHLPQGVALWSMTLPVLVAVAAFWGTSALRDLGRRLVRWRVPARAYVVAVAFPVAVAGAAVAVTAALGQPLAVGGAMSLPGALGFLAFGTFLYLLTEELAWRGVLLPRLAARLGVGPAGLVVGGVWALWHVPLLSVPGEHDQGLPLGGFLILVLATGVVMAFLMDHARYSVLVGAVFHAAFNAAYSYTGVVGGSPATFWAAVVLTVLVAAGLLARGRRRAPAVPGSPTSEPQLAR